MFRTVPLPIIRSFSLYTQQWYMSYRFTDSLRAGSGWNSSWSCSQAVSKPLWHTRCGRKHNFTSDALNNRVTTVASSNLCWVYGRGYPNCRVKGEAAALWVRAQRCQSHYFSTTPCVSHRFADSLRAGSERVSSWSCSQVVSKPVWHIPLLCVQ